MAAHLVWLVGNRFDNSVCVCVYVYHLTMRKPHMLTTDMIEIIQAYPLGLVASIRPDGRPAVSPKGTFFLIRPEQIACAHIRSPKTVRNIQQNSHVEVNFVDILSRIAVRIEARAQYIALADADNFITTAFRAVWADFEPIVNGFIIFDIERAEMIKTPSYDLGISREALIASYQEKLSGIANRSSQ